MDRLMHEGDPTVTTYVFAGFVAIILASIVFGPQPKEGSSENGDLSEHDFDPRIIEGQKRRAGVGRHE